MPKIVKPWNIIGTITKENAKFSCLPESTPICTGVGGTMQSMIGCGLTDIGKAVDVAGTASMFCVSTDGIKPELSIPDSSLIFNSGMLPDTYFYWEYIWGGLALQWFRDKICKKVGNSAYYDAMSDEASKMPPGANGVIFLPYLTGDDGDLSNAFGGFLNVTAETNQATMWRAVLEAISYDYMGVTDIYRAGGANLDQITVAEGGSRSDLWNQIKADMLNSKVTTLKKAGNAVMTNIVIATYAVGDITDLEGSLDSWLEVKKVYEPNPTNTEYYRKVYNMRTQLVHEEISSSFDLLEKVRNEKI
ncbi:FGGY-family carbohydrate kinase [Pseudoramibacter sp. HA2172]|uniref:FGGY-family carbohydrate kinase n=1 Tax=Pseudoramibacter faecis TaxID=3108534 RepID=UPI002E76775A|nr:FGGY-family carbohydrate kinase [Pseudoramibacter sp. HA2172]